ncbi:protein of unknown function (plasmid) [Cupriavidus taiwanensis]|uniref:Uncharacterized protein n=1 Tax=Cupriavidus taiwanensis TaxID=164546 RepID=A0A375INU4_9BURK|nr:protein of unknown function [Cupriavidus taiwanensis]
MIPAGECGRSTYQCQETGKKPK